MSTLSAPCVILSEAKEPKPEHGPLRFAQGDTPTSFFLARGPRFTTRHPTYPTLPSRLIPSSFCASTANSIGSSWKTSLQNPFTIIEIAFSVLRPRCFR